MRCRGDRGACGGDADRVTVVESGFDRDRRELAGERAGPLDERPDVVSNPLVWAVSTRAAAPESRSND